MRLFPQPFRHCLGHLLAEGKHGLGQLLQGLLGCLHARLQSIQPLIEAVMQTVPNLAAPPCVAKLLQREDRRRGQAPVLPMSTVFRISFPLTPNMGGQFLCPKNQGMLP